MYDREITGAENRRPFKRRETAGSRGGGLRAMRVVVAVHALAQAPCNAAAPWPVEGLEPLMLVQERQFCVQRPCPSVVFSDEREYARCMSSAESSLQYCAFADGWTGWAAMASALSRLWRFGRRGGPGEPGEAQGGRPRGGLVLSVLSVAVGSGGGSRRRVRQCVVQTLERCCLGRLAVSSQGAGRVAVTCPLYASSDIDVWKHGPWKQAWGPPRRSSLEIGNPFSHSANNRCRRLSPVSRNVKITDHLCLGALQQRYLSPWPARPERFRRRFRHVLSFHVNSYAGNASNSPIDDVAASTTCRRLSRGAFKLLHAQSHQATQTAPLKSITTLSTLLCTFIHGSVEIKHGHLFEG